MVNDGMTIYLDHPVNPKSRWELDKKPNLLLYNIINQNRENYKKILKNFLKYTNNFLKISVNPISDFSPDPFWKNEFIPALDGIALYSFLCENNPKKYFEIGSGNSTKFARRAIRDNYLNTKILSIDPFPRATIDSICDEIIRQPLEDTDLEIFSQLNAGDILFIDGSHRVFTNSDVTVMMLEILPNLNSGVFIEIHDIFLPYDYPPSWADRFYSEQYLLAAYLIGKGRIFEILLPNLFISVDKELNSILSPIWNSSQLKGIEPHGGSFWIKKC